MKKRNIYLIYIFAIVLTINTANSLPEMLDGFNGKYNTNGTVLGTCNTCHIPDKPQRPTCDELCHIPNKPQRQSLDNLNPYGISIKNNLNIDGMNQAFTAVENLDSDGDGFSNINEINNLTFPGDKRDFPKGKKDILPNTKLSDILNFSILNFSIP